MNQQNRTDISFPLRLDNRGRLTRCDYEQHVREMLEQLLFTQPGERVNRPEFGTPISASIFDRPTPEVLSYLEFQISTSVQRFMGDVIALENIVVQVEENQLHVTLQYLIYESNNSVEEVFSS